MNKTFDSQISATPRSPRPRRLAPATARPRKTAVGNETNTDRVVEKLTGLILGGVLKRGESLPPERELALQLGVSRPVVREATKTLHAQGLVNIRHGVGTIVNGANSMSVQKGFSQALYGKDDAIAKLYEVRAVLEPEIVRLAAQKATPADLERLRQICLDLDATTGSDLARRIQFVQLDMAFHGTLAEATGNEAFVVVLEAATTLLVNEYIRSPRLGVSNPTTQLMHKAILEAVKHRDGELAADLMRRHLKPLSLLRPSERGGDKG